MAFARTAGHVDFIMKLKDLSKFSKFQHLYQKELPPVTSRVYVKNFFSWTVTRSNSPCSMHWTLFSQPILPPCGANPPEQRLFWRSIIGRSLPNLMLRSQEFYAHRWFLGTVKLLIHMGDHSTEDRIKISGYVPMEESSKGQTSDWNTSIQVLPLVNRPKWKRSLNRSLKCPLELSSLSVPVCKIQVARDFGLENKDILPWEGLTMWRASVRTRRGWLLQQPEKG